MLLFSTASLYSINWQMLTALRFLTGFSMAAHNVATKAWILEVLKPDQRMFMIAVSNGWGPGRLLYASAAAVTGNWKATFWICNGTTVLVLIIVLVGTTESARWLAQQAKPDELRKAQEFEAEMNGEKPIFDSIKPCKSRVYTYKDLFANSKIRNRTLIMSFSLFALAFTSFGIDAKSGSLPGNLIANQLIMSVLLTASRPLCWVVDYKFPKFNRRNLHLTTLGPLFPILLALAILSSHEDSSFGINTVIVVIYIIGVLIIELHWVAVGLYLGELFPTVCRTTAMAFILVCGRFGNVAASYAVYLGRMWGPAPYVIFILFCSTYFALSFFFLPDTKGEELPDTINFEVTAPLHGHHKDAEK